MQSVLKSKCHAAGLRLTHQRTAIYGDLASRFDHPDVETLFHAARVKVPSLSVFGVYRTMNAFEAAGLIRRVATWEGHARYDANVAAHAHFLCESCGRIDDVAVGGIEALRRAGAVATHSQVQDVDVTFRGTCVACARARAEPQEPSRSDSRRRGSLRSGGCSSRKRSQVRA